MTLSPIVTTFWVVPLPQEGGGAGPVSVRAVCRDLMAPLIWGQIPYAGLLGPDKYGDRAVHTLGLRRSPFQ